MNVDLSVFCETHKKLLSQLKASKIVAKELHDDWMSKNVYSIHEKSIDSTIKNKYSTFLALIKHYRNKYH